MATKQLNINQHDILHLNYPDNCCLCKAEQRIKDLENKISTLSSNSQNCGVSEEEIAETFKKILWNKIEIFLDCAKDCEKHKCHSGMGTLLSFTAEELSKALSSRLPKIERERLIELIYNGLYQGLDIALMPTDDTKDKIIKEQSEIRVKHLSRKLADAIMEGV